MADPAAPLVHARHEAFVRAILAGQRARDAYLSAGYRATPAAADVAASRLIRRPEVAARIAALQAAAAEGAVLSARQVLEELSRIAAASVTDYLAAGEGGTLAPDLARLTREQAAAIAELTVDDRGEAGRRTRIRLHDKRAALHDLARHHGLLRDRVEVTGAEGGAVRVEEVGELELARRIAFVLERGAAAGPARRSRKRPAKKERR